MREPLGLMAPIAGIRILALDPDLAAPLPVQQRPLAERNLVVPSVRVPTGPWDPDDLGPSQYGVLVVEGLVAREVTVAGTAAAELLGAGDVLRTGTTASEELVTSTATWTVLEPLHLALLDDHFGHALRRWPELGQCLLMRAEQRAARLAVYQAISHLTRVDTRVLVMLWMLAGRWGRVTGEGIALPLRLTHRTIARLVGARRPSVTTAITQLCRRELLARRSDGSWLLHGPPPQELARVGVDAILSAPAPAPVRRPAPAPDPPSDADAAAGDGAAMAAQAHRVREQTRINVQRIRTTMAQIHQLADAYETQAERTRTTANRTRELREHSRELRAQVSASRERRRPPDRG